MGEWSSAPFGQLVENFDSIRVPVKEADRKPGRYPYYGASGVVDHVDGYIFDGEYLLVAEDGENLKTRQTPIAFLATGKFWVNNHAHIVRANANNDTRFLMYAMRVADIGSYLTGSTMPKLTQANMNRVPVVAPPLAQQRAIARILGALDAKIELNRKTNATLEAMARALFKSWFVDFDPVRAKAEGRAPSGMDADTAKLFPSEFVESAIGMIPSGWRVVYLSEIAGITSGKRPTERHDVASTTASVPLFGGGGVMAYVSEPLLQQRAILTGRVGTLGLLFRVTEPVWPSDNTLVIRPHRDFDFDLVRLHLERVDFASLNRGSTQPLLTQRDLGAQCFVHASESARKAFAGIVEQWMAAVDRRKTETTRLSAIRDALLPRLLSGELQVDAAPRAASEVA